MAKAENCAAALAAFQKIRILTLGGDAEETLKSGLSNKAPGLIAYVEDLRPLKALCGFSQTSTKPTMHVAFLVEHSLDGFV